MSRRASCRQIIYIKIHFYRRRGFYDRQRGVGFICFWFRTPVGRFNPVCLFRENCRLILMGDVAQLPPVMQTESPALNPEILRGYNLQVWEIALTQVVRQSEDSGILFNATRLRDALRNHTVEIFPKLQLKGFSDFTKVNGDELIEEISSAYSRDGMEETMIISRSNKRATIYNNGIRNRILYREEELSSGDRLMVAKNNYY